MRTVNRLRAAGLLVGLGLLATHRPADAQESFPQGIGSGDVTETSAILWTRARMPGEVLVELANDSTFSQTVAHVVVNAVADDDQIVRIDATGLQPATRYYYRFISLETAEASPAGTFRTAPTAAESHSLRFVYSGDSNALFQPFTLLRHAAEEQADFWFWAGDTMYADEVLQSVAPATDLAGFRDRHRENREDEPLRELLAACPVWAQWDDHELGNDYDGGDLNPRYSEQQRREAYQAFFDYMPIRRSQATGEAFRIYRSFRYGALAEFFILDCRQYRSRSVQRDGGGLDPRAFILPTLELDSIRKMHDPVRTMLGAEQLAWLQENLRTSTARWKFVLSSVPFTSLLIMPYDRWDGYAAERYELLRYIDEQRIDGVILLSADIHANLYNPDVTQFLRNTLLQSFSPCFRVPEFVAGPIGVDTLKQSARHFFGRFLDLGPNETEASFLFRFTYDIVAARVAAANGLAFMEPDRFAYLVVDVSEDGVRLTHRGIVSDPIITDAPLETLHSVTLSNPQPPSCAPGILAPLCLCLIAGLQRRPGVNPLRCRRASGAGAR